MAFQMFYHSKERKESQFIILKKKKLCTLLPHRNLNFWFCFPPRALGLKTENVNEDSPRKIRNRKGKQKNTKSELPVSQKKVDSNIRKALPVAIN